MATRFHLNNKNNNIERMSSITLLDTNQRIKWPTILPIAIILGRIKWLPNSIQWLYMENNWMTDWFSLFYVKRRISNECQILHIDTRIIKLGGCLTFPNENRLKIGHPFNIWLEKEYQVGARYSTKLEQIFLFTTLGGCPIIHDNVIGGWIGRTSNTLEKIV
jgi:hypothetical protein